MILAWASPFNVLNCISVMNPNFDFGVHSVADHWTWPGCYIDYNPVSHDLCGWTAGRGSFGHPDHLGSCRGHGGHGLGFQSFESERLFPGLASGPVSR